MTTDALLKNLDELQARALKELEESASSEALEQWRVAFLGRRGELTQVLRGLSSIAPEERRTVGAAANKVKDVLEERLAGAEESVKTAQLKGPRGAGENRRYPAGQDPAGGTPPSHYADGP